jgi:hypothetical protein
VFQGELRQIAASPDSRKEQRLWEELQLLEGD